MNAGKVIVGGIASGINGAVVVGLCAAVASVATLTKTTAARRARWSRISTSGRAGQTTDYPSRGE
jgi:hypothetical protein